MRLMKKLGEAERARCFKAAQQHEELLEAQQQAAAMSVKADALKHALAVSEAEHARREYASSIGMASPTRLLKVAHLRSTPGPGNPGSRKKHASRTSPSREGAPSRLGGAIEDSTTRAQLNFKVFPHLFGPALVHFVVRIVRTVHSVLCVRRKLVLRLR